MIRQFDVFANPNLGRAEQFPFVVVLQSDWVSDTASVIVAPLVEADEHRPARLYPVFDIEGRRLAAAMSDLAAIPRGLLSKPVANLAPERDSIIAARDLLFTGY